VLYRAIRACTFAGRYWEPGETTGYIPGIEKCQHFAKGGAPSGEVQRQEEETEVKAKRRRGAG